MFKWLFGNKAKDDGFVTELMKSAGIGERYKKLNAALSTVSSEQMSHKDVMASATASAILVKAITNEANIRINNDDDRFVAGIFAFVFTDYFSSLLDEMFESASTIAVGQVVGVDELERCIKTIIDAHTNLSKTRPKIIQAIGETCANWYGDATRENFMKLPTLYLALRESIQVK